MVTKSPGIWGPPLRVKGSEPAGRVLVGNSSQHVLTLSNPIPVSQLVELSLKDPFLSPPHPQQLSSQEILDALAGPVTADLSRVVLLQGLLPAGENAHGA